MIALAGLETLLILSWTILGASLLALLWSRWYLGIPFFYMMALGLTAGVENTSRQSPATALGISIHGERTYGMKILRIGITPPMLLLGLLGYLSCFRGGLSVPERVSGADFRELELQLDPRPRDIIIRGRAVAKNWVRAYTASAIVVSAVMFILANPLVIEEERVGTADHDITELSRSDRELLAAYLELSALHPEELEYHVRLASLYYRNSMHEDLQNQLEEVRRLNPEHSILVLADSSRITFEDLLPASDRDSLPDEPVFIPSLPDTTVQEPEPELESEPELEPEPEPELEPEPEPIEETTSETEETPAPDDPPDVQPDSL